MALSKERLLQMNRDAANAWYLNLTRGREPDGRNYYIGERQLTPQTIRNYGLGYAPKQDWTFMIRELQKKGYSVDEMVEGGLAKISEKSGKPYDFFHGRVMIPIVDTKGDVIGFGGRVLDDSKPKYLNSSDTVAFNKKENMFSLNHARHSEADTLILAEGYMDVIAMNQAGFTEAIASLGTAFTEQQARLISFYTDKVICAYDNDEAGTRAKRKAIDLLSDVGVEVRILDMTGSGAKDPDEFIKKYGKENFQKLLDTAVNAFDWTLRFCQQNFDLNTDNGKNELAERIWRPLSMLPETEQKAAREFLNQKYGFDFRPNTEQAVEQLPLLDDKTMELINDTNQYQKLAHCSPETAISQCGLPEWISDTFGQSGFTTIGEAAECNYHDITVIFEGDMEIVDEVCDTLGIPKNKAHGGLDD